MLRMEAPQPHNPGVLGVLVEVVENRVRSLVRVRARVGMVVGRERRGSRSRFCFSLGCKLV